MHSFAAAEKAKGGNAETQMISSADGCSRPVRPSTILRKRDHGEAFAFEQLGEHGSGDFVGLVLGGNHEDAAGRDRLLEDLRIARRRSR